MSIGGKPSAYVKPTLDTRFHIDYDWWESSTDPGKDLRTYLLSHIAPEYREHLSQSPADKKVDYVDPETAEVSQLDELNLAIRQASEEPDFISEDISLVDSVFRVFLSNGNTPLSCHELEAVTGRQARTILNLLSGKRVYKGLRPYHEKTEEEVEEE